MILSKECKLFFSFTLWNSQDAEACIIPACMLSCFSCVWLCQILWTVAHQAPLFMGFSKQEYLSRWPCLSSGDLPSPVIEPISLTSPALAGRFFTTSSTWEDPCIIHLPLKICCWKASASAQISSSRPLWWSFRCSAVLIQNHRRWLSPNQHAHHFLVVWFNLWPQIPHLQSRDNRSGPWI